MHIAQNWRIRRTRYVLEGVRCDRCGAILFPTRATCPHCAATDQAGQSAQGAQVDNQTVGQMFADHANNGTQWSQAAR